MVFSVKDLLLNSNQSYNGEAGSCTIKYFEDFDIDAYTINVSASTYKPTFITQIAIGSGVSSFDAVIGSAGLAVGNYSYSYRMVTASGERSSFSPITELIPVVRNVSQGSGVFLIIILSVVKQTLLTQVNMEIILG